MTLRVPLFCAAVLLSGTAFFVSQAGAAPGDDAQCKGASNFDRRIESCTRLIARGGADAAYAYNDRGIARFLKGNCDLALKDYDAALALVNKSFRKADRAVLARQIRLNMVDVHANCQGDLDRALQIIDIIFAEHPGDADAHAKKARVSLMKRDFQQAFQNYAAALLTSDNPGNLYIARATAKQMLGNLNGALEDMEKAVATKPGDPNVLHERGTIHTARGNYDLALADYERALKASPGNSRFIASRGDTRRLQGNMAQALEDLNRAIALDGPDKVSIAYVSRGDAFRYLGQYDRAIADFGKVISDFYGAKVGAAYVGRGLTFERLGQLDRARADFATAVGLSPFSSDSNAAAQETAKARIAALDSGGALPDIRPVPETVWSATSIPTAKEAVAVPSVSTQSLDATKIKQERRIALIIGNSAYKAVTPLANPRHDADAVAASFRNIGFDNVTSANDASREALVNVLRAFAEEAEKADWAVVYYAGHGIEVNGTNYLIPVDAKLAADRDVQFEAVPLDQVMASVEGAKKISVVILDACRDNPFAPQMRKTAAPEVTAGRTTGGGKVTTRSVGRGLGDVKVSGASLVVFAAKHGQIALDGEGGNSPFAIAMVQRLATPGVEINKIFRLIRDDVMEATAGRQEPFTYGSLPGREEFFFVAKN